jgi:hypothetical protein
MNSSMTVMTMLEICSSCAMSPAWPEVPAMPVANFSSRALAASFAPPCHSLSCSSAVCTNFTAYCERP